MLENIELFGNSLGTGTYPDGEGKSFLQNIFDVIHPIGETYVQYPQQLPPTELYNKKDGDRIIIDSVWEEQLQYDGAFFRAENDALYVYKVDGETQYYALDGSDNPTIPVKAASDISGSTITLTQEGNPVTYDGKTYLAYKVNGATNRALDYIEEGNSLIIQESENKSHTHDWSNTHKHSITDPGHSHSYVYRDETKWNGDNAWGADDSLISGTTGSSKTGISIDNKTISGTTTSEGGDESRPDNYTYRIWKRIL